LSNFIFVNFFLSIFTFSIIMILNHYVNNISDNEAYSTFRNYKKMRKANILKKINHIYVN